LAHPVTWFEIIGTDPAALHKFYKDVFDWKLSDPAVEMGNYSMVDNEGRGIGGGIGGAMDGNNRTTLYIEVESVQSALDKAASNGAEVVMPTMKVMEGVTIAMFKDPGGNVVGLLEAYDMPAQQA
jgi:predicted enzyme related to lactoylglutathione lyase